MNCTECITPNNIPNCYTGSVTITVGYLEAAYFSTTVVVKIVNVATGKERYESVTTDANGVVTFTAFNMGSHYQLEVLDATTWQSLTIYSDETSDGGTIYSCCVEFKTIEYNTSTDITFNFEECSGSSSASAVGNCCVGVADGGIEVLSNAHEIDFIGFTVVDNGDGTVSVTAGAGSGDVTGPGSSVDDNIVTFNGVTGKIIKDSGVAITQISTNTSDIADRVVGPVSSTDDTLVVWDGVTGKLVKNSSIDKDDVVTPSSTDTFTNKTFDANAAGNSLSNVDVADLANGTDGELITWDAAGVPATVPVGTATHVLTSNGVGAAPTFQAPSGGGILWSFAGAFIGGAPADSTTYYWGARYQTLQTTFYNPAFLVPVDCSVKGISLMWSCGNVPSSESTSFYLRVNNTTDYTLTTGAKWDGSGTGGGLWGISTNINGFYSDSLSNNYSAGDLISLKMVIPVMTTNPITSYGTFTVWFESQ